MRSLKIRAICTLKQLAPLAVLICSLTTSGCSSASKSRDSELPALTAAKREVLEKWGWRKVQVNSAHFEDGRWVVHVTMLPKTPGGHATIEASEAGKVIASRGGR